MNRTQTDKFPLTSNIDVTVIKEIKEGGEYYALVKISVFGWHSYGVCMLGDEYAFESVGDDIKNATELFDIVVNEMPEPSQLFDVVTDFRHGKAYE